MRDAFISQWSWDDDSHTSGRMTVIITSDDMYQSQKTTNFVVGETVDIYGHSFTVSLDCFGNPRIE